MPPLDTMKPRKRWLKNPFSPVEAEETIALMDIEDVKRCLQKAKTDAKLGYHFSSINDNRMSQMANRICSLLDYAFKYDRLYPFIGLFKYHTMMKLSQEEVDAFFDLLVNECFVGKGKNGLMPCQAKVLNRIKTLILHGSLKAVSQNDIAEFKRNLQHNHVLKERFQFVTLKQVEKIMHQFINILKPTATEELMEMLIDKHKNYWISEEEYDEFIKEFLSLYEDRDFLNEAAPVLSEVRKRMVVFAPNHELHVYNQFLTSRIFAIRFSDIEPEKLRAIVSKMVKCVTDFPRSTDDIRTIAISHITLKLTELEIRELEDVFSFVKHNTYEYRAKLRLAFNFFIDTVREYHGLIEE